MQSLTPSRSWGCMARCTRLPCQRIGFALDGHATMALFYTLRATVRLRRLKWTKNGHAHLIKQILNFEQI
jgi:hypothetical protein